MITDNILHRTYHLRFQAGGVVQYGTGFAIDVDGEEYLATARHLIAGGELESLQICVNDQWRELPAATVIGRGRGEIDVAVIKVEPKLAPEGFEVALTSAHLQLGGDVIFLGFPFGLSSDFGNLMRGLPCAFGKKGMLSSMQAGPGKAQIFYVDALNNPGFSGGPLFFNYQAPGAAPEVRVFGIVSKFRVERESVVDMNGSWTGMTVEYNTGILVAYGTNHAEELVRAHKAKQGAQQLQR